LPAEIIMKIIAYGLLTAIVLPIMVIAKTTTPVNKDAETEPTSENKIFEDEYINSRSPANWLKWLESRHEAIITDQIRIHVFRLHPGNDLLGSLRTYVKQHHIHAAVLLSAVGSLTQVSLRYANQSKACVYTGHFEIVSVTGTIEEGSEHIHLSIATSRGNVIGGHLLTGCTIYTTIEIVLGELIGVQFAREMDKESGGWKELKVYKKQIPT
jgi:predicted DNA-binding protein with PD1-like motif